MKYLMSLAAAMLGLTLPVLAGAQQGAGGTTAVPPGHALTGELATPRGDDGPVIVVVAGATGRTGQQVVAELLRNPRYAIRGLARDPAAAAVEVPGGDRVQWLRGDVRKPETLAPALKGAALLVSAIGATERSGPNGPEFVDFGGVRNLADAARDAGTRQFVLISSMGVESGGGFVGWILNLIGGDVLEWKARGEDYLRRSGVPYTIIRPGGLRDDAGGDKGIRFQQGDQGMGSIARADVARVTVAALDNPDAVNRTFEIRDDDELPAGGWAGQFRGLKPDPAPAP